MVVADIDRENSMLVPNHVTGSQAEPGQRSKRTWQAAVYPKPEAHSIS